MNRTILRSFIILSGIMAGMLLFSCVKNENQNNTTSQDDLEEISNPVKPARKDSHPARQLDFPESENTEVPTKHEKISKNWPQVHIKNNLGFGLPLDPPLILSGSFGELRGNHFHAGLDIRTGGQEGKNVYAIADGVVSRIKVSSRGYGKVLYVRHSNGYTSVYGHLKGFNSTIESYVEKKQYEKRSYAIELFPGNALKVKKGQVIALSGNTGGSVGPHLHFEIRDSKTEQTLNPLLYGIPLRDKIGPNIFSMVVYEIDDVYRKTTGNYPFKKYKSNTRTIILPPAKYALATQNRDYQIDKLNKLGINYTRLAINDKVIFSSAIERFPFDKSRYIQNHYDYYIKSKTGQVYTKLYLEKRNPLPFYKHEKKGVFRLKHGDTLKVFVQVADFSLKKKDIRFLLIGDSSSRALPRKSSPSHTMTARAWRNSSYSKNGLKLYIPSRALYRDQNLTISKSHNKYSPYSDLHSVHRDEVPLQTYYTIEIEAKNYERIDPSKLLIVNRLKGGGKVSEGGSFSRGTVKTKTRSFGTYYIGIDTIAPKVKVSVKNRNIFIRPSDNLSGISEYIVAIDDQWILVEYHPNMKKMIGTIPQWVKPGKHLLEIKVWDNKRNKTYKKLNIQVQ